MCVANIGSKSSGQHSAKSTALIEKYYDDIQQQK